MDMITMVYQQYGVATALLQCFHLNISITSLETGSLPVLWTTRGLHILKTYLLRIIFCGDT